MLFAVIRGPTLCEAKAEIEEISSLVDGVELRLDHFTSWTLDGIEELLKTSPIPCMLTLRNQKQTSCFREQITQIFQLQPSYIDLEGDRNCIWLEEIIQSYPKTKTILSYHNFERTPQDLESIVEKMRIEGAYGYKLAAKAQSTLDALRMLLFVQEMTDRGEKVTGISMGEYGIPTRILGPIVGNMIDYTFWKNPVPGIGQIGIKELLGRYRYRKLTRGSPIYALLGDPVDQSLSHITHNHVLEKLGWEGVYCKMRLRPNELELFKQFAEHLPFRGLSVTMPLKEKCVVFEQNPRNIPINTIVIDQGWKGHNTDGVGALDLIERREKVQGRLVLILGAGGTARAIAQEARRRGADLLIYNRTIEKAEILAREVEGKVWGKEGKFLYDILVNCTNVGMVPQEQHSPFEKEDLLPGTLVMDVVASPPMTKFLLEAQGKGCRIISGGELFARQAAWQFALWK